MQYAPLNDAAGDRVIASARPIAGATVARARRRARGPVGRAACRIAGPANGASARTSRSNPAGHRCLKIFRWVMTHAGAWAGVTARAPSCLRRLRQATASTTALRAPTRPAPGRLAIALLGLPAPPPGGRLPTAVAAVPRLRRRGARRTGRSLSADIAAPVAAAADEALASDGDLVDRWTGPQEAAFLLSGSSLGGELLPSPPRRTHAYCGRAARLTASLYSSDSSIRYHPAWTSDIGDPDRRLWTRGPPPRWTSFKPALTDRSRH